MQEQKTVAVTAQHITRGIRADCSCCPLALAASDAFPGKLCIATWDRIYVYPDAGTHRDYIENGELAERGPDEIWNHNGDNFITRFDAGKDVEPQDIDLWLEKRSA